MNRASHISRAMSLPRRLTRSLSAHAVTVAYSASLLTPPNSGDSASDLFDAMASDLEDVVENGVLRKIMVATVALASVSGLSPYTAPASGTGRICFLYFLIICP